MTQNAQRCWTEYHHCYNGIEGLKFITSWMPYKSSLYQRIGLACTVFLSPWQDSSSNSVTQHPMALLCLRNLQSDNQHLFQVAGCLLPRTTLGCSDMDVLCSVPWRAVVIDTVMYCQRKVMEIDNALVASPKIPHVRQPQAQLNYKFRCSLCQLQGLTINCHFQWSLSFLPVNRNVKILLNQ